MQVPGHNKGLAVKKVRGEERGVFAEEKFLEGAVVISDHVVAFPEHEHKHIDETSLETYYFHIDGDNFIALGLTSLVNHSDTPNCEPHYNKAERIVEFIAIEPIAIGNEITIDYGWESYPWK